MVADGKGGEAGPEAVRFKGRDFAFQFGKNLVANFESVKDACSHARLTFDE